jgi:DnaJ-class molecular chaperone
MARLPYQDMHPEVDCPECGGAGFFGNGPQVDPCDYCGGTGVLIDGSQLLSARKPSGRAMTSATSVKTTQVRGGER